MIMEMLNRFPSQETIDKLAPFKKRKTIYGYRVYNITMADAQIMEAREEIKKIA